MDNCATDGAEIDIFESYDIKNGNINHAIHYDGYSEYHQSVGRTTTNIDLYDGNYHSFALLWNDDRHYFYIDGEIVNTIDKTQEDFPGLSTKPSYLKITAEFGSWAGYISKDTLPDALVVDYVRYTKNLDNRQLKQKLSSKYRGQFLVGFKFGSEFDFVGVKT